jgi:DNA-binding CsgD family transcriptional regulator
VHADEESRLAGADLELLAVSAYMVGDENQWLAALERAHHAYRTAGEPRSAARCAFWIGMSLGAGGHVGPASGWFGRAQRLLEPEGDCVECGYLLLPTMFRHESGGDFRAAADVAGDAAAAGQRFDDPDLLALATHAQGHMLIKAGCVDEGLPLLDEAMVAAATDELSPVVTGIVYCGVILACREVYELRRASDWTALLSRWCERQHDLVAFTGRCLLHRAEIMQIRGAWDDALAEARRAAPRLQRTNPRAAGQAFYRQGELHRLLGDLDAAESAYRAASRAGCEPQPGLALLRMAQGRPEAATTAIRRVTAETTSLAARADLLTASVEVMLAAGATDDARSACAEIERLAGRAKSPMLHAMAAHARGAVELAEGDAEAAVAPLRTAQRMWHELEAPYEVARVRTLLASACRALGDADAAVLELDAARETFMRLGAALDVARADALSEGPPPSTHGLTDRQLDVLRLIAAGKTNREIASELVISEHTVARHVQDIFRRLHVSSRSAATAFAFEHELV